MPVIFFGDYMDDISVKIRRIIPDVSFPVRNGACYDLFMPETVTINAGETVKIRTGIAVKLPKGFYALINMRSSTWSKFGVCLTNQTGIIDNAYCGNNDEWLLSVYRPRSFGEPVTIPKGARIAQFRLEREGPCINWEEVDDLETPDRGGFGSTGE